MSYTEEFRSQSSRWNWAIVTFEGVEGVGPSTSKVSNVRLFKRTNGTCTEYVVRPGGEWLGEKVRWAGYVTAYRQPAELALGNRSNWSGGGNYHGWVFIKPGGAIEFSSRGKHSYLYNENGALKWSNFPPDAESAEEV